MRRGLEMLWALVIVGGLGVCAAADAQEPEAQEHASEIDAARLHLALDLVFGFHEQLSSVPAFFPLDSALSLPSRPVDTGSGLTESLLASGSYELLPQLRAGARIGIGVAHNVSTGVTDSRASAALSNLELEAEYAVPLSETTELAISLAVALPTAQGTTEVTETDLQAALRGQVKTAFLQNGVQRAVAESRGYEESALFAVGRVGVIPKLALFHHSGALRLEAYIKLENLIRMGSGSQGVGSAAVVAPRAWVELVAAGFAGYALLPALTAGLRVWTNLDLTETDRSALMLEPQLRLDIGALQARLGVITPLASPLQEPVVAGVRLAAAARF
jgi:hypothetical protein